MNNRLLLTRLSCGLAAAVLPALASASAGQASAERGAEADFVVTVVAPRAEHRPATPPDIADRDVLPEWPDAEELFDRSALLSDQQDWLAAALEQALAGIDLYIGGNDQTADL